MTHKRALLPLVALFLLAGAAGAQQSPRARTRARPAMWAALQLSESQKQQVATIHKQYAAALRVARKQASDSGVSVFAQEMAEVRSILSVSQQETFDAYASTSGRPRRGSVARVVPLKIAIPH